MFDPPNQKMELEQNQLGTALPAHVLIFPLPLLGHVNSMLKLAELLCLSGLHITVLLSEYDHARLLRHANLDTRFSRYSESFRIATISDGLPDEHPRSGKRVLDTMLSLRVVGESQFRDLMISTDLLSYGGARQPVTCFILDGVLSFAARVGDEMGIPYLYFRTVSACSFWCYFCIPEIIEAGQVPLKGKDEDKMSYWSKREMELLVTSVPGMEGFLRQRDLPEFMRVDDINDPSFVTISTESRGTTRAKGLILNTFEDLERPVLSEIRKRIPTVYPIGPLHALLKARIAGNSTGHTASFWEEDKSCISWLDSQPPKSVIYVSFGSVTILTRDELLEFWYGLVNSGHNFLWVIRPDSVVGGIQIPPDLEQGTKARGYLVGWVPQEEVLSHAAIGGFLTHSGWNSTLESIVVGMPMICWPNFADQPTNSRFVSEIWKIGLDMKDTCDRGIVERNIRDIMKDGRVKLLERTSRMSQLAKKAIAQNGSSYHNLECLIEFIKSTTTK